MSHRMLQNCWISSPAPLEVPVFIKEFYVDGLSGQTWLHITSHGLYAAFINGVRVGDIFAPGYTSHGPGGRLLAQAIDISVHVIPGMNTVWIMVAPGWHRGALMRFDKASPRTAHPAGLAAIIACPRHGGPGLLAKTDATWRISPGPVVSAQIYDGETYDARIEPNVGDAVQAVEYPGPGFTIVPQGSTPPVIEADLLHPCCIFTDSAGKTIIDFGQNITGYVHLHFDKTTHEGDELQISFGEVLQGSDLYTANLRSAKCKLHYICTQGAQTYTPLFTFFGFRYIRIDTQPGGLMVSKTRARAVHSQLVRTGWLTGGHTLLNQLFENIIWGQKGNFLSVPTDCPQRDERLGWTGDAQVFVRTAAFNFDVEDFFASWLTDLALDQHSDGNVPYVIPDTYEGKAGSAAWGDAAVICPWEIHIAYGTNILAQQYSSMKAWVNYVTSATTTPNLWTGGKHFGDWLALDAESDMAHDPSAGASRHDFIASCFYANSTRILANAAEHLGLQEDARHYWALNRAIRTQITASFPLPLSQTEYALMLHFGLSATPAAHANALADMVRKVGTRLSTGFVGTPYLLHALSDNGHTKLAYDLLLRTEYPGWLYPITQGATTIWERWDSIKPDGTFADPGMNSFNHYAYGAVKDWIYSVAAGIRALETHPGYARIDFAPKPDERLGWLCATLHTRRGPVVSKWEYLSDTIRFYIETPSPGVVRIFDKSISIGPGAHTFFAQPPK